MSGTHDEYEAELHNATVSLAGGDPGAAPVEAAGESGGAGQASVGMGRWAALKRRYIAMAPGLVGVYAVLTAFLLGAVVLLIAGHNPLRAYWYLIEGMCGDWHAIQGTLGKSIPYIGASLAVVLAFKAGMFNVGAQGQLLFGALAGAWVGTWGLIRDWPAVPAVIAVLVAGSVAGFLWGVLPGWLKVKTGANEVITTIMLNFVMQFAATFIVEERNPVILLDTSSSTSHSRPMWPATLLPKAAGDTELHLGLLFVIVFAVLAWWFLKRTVLGYEIRLTGTNPWAAKASGISTGFIAILAIGLGGALAGFTGAAQVQGTEGYLSVGRFTNIGWDALAIAILGRNNPIGVVFASIGWAAMLSGAPSMQLRAGVSLDIVQVIQACVLILVVGDTIVRRLYALPARRGSAPVMSAGWGS